MQLRDYRYLDREKLEDYLSGMDTGVVESVKEVIKTEDSPDSVSNPPTLGAAPPSQSSVETTNERVLSISAKHSFSRLYDAVGDSLASFEDGLPTDVTLKKNQVIEITDEFYPSPINQMIDSMTNFMDTMQQMSFMGGMEALDTPEGQQAMQLMSTLFAGNTETNMLPMVAGQTDQTKLLFMAVEKYIIGSREDFEGELTLFGKVAKVISPSESVDLLELLKVLPRSLRRGGMADSFRATMVEAFKQWPSELGGGIDAAALTLAGPAYVITPVAVYT